MGQQRGYCVKKQRGCSAGQLNIPIARFKVHAREAHVLQVGHPHEADPSRSHGEELGLAGEWYALPYLQPPSMLLHVPELAPVRACACP